MLTLTLVLCITAAYAIHAHRASAAPDARHNARFMIVQRLRSGLAGTPLERYAFAIERAAREWNVSPYLIAAIAGDESTFGEAACGGNAWGVDSCGVTFPDFAAGAMYEARLLRAGYLNRGASSVWAIAASYCPGCSEWPGNVAAFMARFGASPYQVTYPKGAS